MCGLDQFNNTEEETVIKYNIDSYNCVTDMDYDFQGNFYRD